MRGTYRNDPFTGNMGKLAPHPALQATFPEGKAFLLVVPPYATAAGGAAAGTEAAGGRAPPKPPDGRLRPAPPPLLKPPPGRNPPPGRGPPPGLGPPPKPGPGPKPGPPKPGPRGGGGAAGGAGARTHGPCCTRTYCCRSCCRRHRRAGRRPRGTHQVGDEPDDQQHRHNQQNKAHNIGPSFIGGAGIGIAAVQRYAVDAAQPVGQRLHGLFGCRCRNHR